MKKIILLLLVLLSFREEKIEACTGIRLHAQDGSMVHGRTLEFGKQLPTTAAVIPRKYPFVGTTSLGQGMGYVTKYGYVGALVFDTLSALDGINEKGLSIGTFFFPGYAEYAQITADNQEKALSPSEFPNWVLSQFATVEEVKAALPSVVIAPTKEAGWGGTPPPFHYIVYDKAGGCLVIEPLDGTLVTYPNPLGVLTNSPTFEWHMTNLRNYINLRTLNVPSVTVDGVLLAPFGQGSGLVGLPGDFTPPSRFVRAVLFSHAALPAKNTEEAVFQAFHILNLFDIPLGLAREMKEGKVLYTDSTSVTCVRDPQNQKYYYRSYDDQSIKMIDLHAFDLNATTIKKLPIGGKQPVTDVSCMLKST